MRDRLKAFILRHPSLRNHINALVLRLIDYLKSKSYLLRGFGWGGLLFISLFIRNSFYGLIVFVMQMKRPEKKRKDRDFSVRVFFLQAVSGSRHASVERYKRIADKKQPSKELHIVLFHRFMALGRLDLAKHIALNLLNSPVNSLLIEERLQLYRDCGVIHFMLGENEQAISCWKYAGEIRKILLGPYQEEVYRILGTSWFVALGHVAMLYYYLQHKKLFQKGNYRIILPFSALPKPFLGCAMDLIDRFRSLGIQVVEDREIPSDYNAWASQRGAPSWEQLNDTNRLALVDEFWEYTFPGGEILNYTHAASRVQHAIEESKGCAPLLYITESEKEWLNTFRAFLGMPHDAWFVCLHVREKGFHQRWNAQLPSMRDAEIADYYLAIEEIIKAGGWVVRMGDPSMTPLPQMDCVVDYAHSPYKSSLADLLLAGSCRFFLGTNSGFATIPIIYGVRCALTNWVPLGWPLWPKKDLMICKLFRYKATQCILSLEEIFERRVAYLQNLRDLPDDLELISNTPEEIRQITLEMLMGNETLNDHFAVIHEQYNQLAQRYGAYTGNRFASSFIKMHPDLFILPKQTEEMAENDQVKFHETAL